MKELKIDIPQGYEIDKESSTFECIKFKPIRGINTIEDLRDTLQQMSGYWINDDAKVQKEDNLYYLENNKNVFLSEKEAKSALAMAQISQLMPYYGGAISDEEWDDIDKKKYVIERTNNIIRGTDYKRTYCYLAFHTEKQRGSFYEHNKQLVKDYFMLD